MNEVSFRTCRMYKVLGNPLRYKVLLELSLSPMTPTRLAKRVCRPLPAVSKALGLLHWAGLVWYKTVGPNVLYGLRHAAVQALVDTGEEFTRRHDCLACADDVAGRFGPWDPGPDRPDPAMPSGDEAPGGGVTPAGDP